MSGWRLMPSKAAITEVHASSADAVRAAERGAAILWTAARKVLGVRAAMPKRLSHNGYKKPSPQTLRLLRERSPCRAPLQGPLDDDDAMMTMLFGPPSALRSGVRSG